MSSTYFGKVPSHGDFVRGPTQHQLIDALDRWMSGGMELLASDPRWKMTYDDAPGLAFAFVGARSSVSVAGYLWPSRDASGRRFPFITATTVDRDDALMFRCAPAGLADSFDQLAYAASAAVAAGDLATTQQSLDMLDCTARFGRAVRSDPLGHFARHTTLGQLGAMLSPSRPLVSVRRAMLSIGILLRPVLGNRALAIEKGLSLPLPWSPPERYLVAGVWLYLVTALLRRTGVEIQLLISDHPSAPRLTIGFNGASPITLLAAFSLQEPACGTIALDDPEWIDDHPDLTQDYGVAKLASYLAQPSLTCEAAFNTYREVFLGE